MEGRESPGTGVITYSVLVLEEKQKVSIHNHSLSLAEPDGRFYLAEKM